MVDTICLIMIVQEQCPVGLQHSPDGGSCAIPILCLRSSNRDRTRGCDSSNRTAKKAGDYANQNLDIT